MNGETLPEFDTHVCLVSEISFQMDVVGVLCAYFGK